MFTISEAFWLGAGVIIVLLAAVEVISIVAKSDANFLESVVLGQDNRTSTSKTFVFMWTLLVGWALFSILIPGELLRTHTCASGSHLQAAYHTCQVAHDNLGKAQVAWKQFQSTGLDSSYLVLLGIPAAAAVGAKAITQSKANSGAIAKRVAPGDQPVSRRVAQIFSADDNTTDIGDFQYVIFNIIAATYFVAEFLNVPMSGLPQLPDTLLGLTSVSAALYVGKKAATNAKPSITGVFPSVLVRGQSAIITGTSFTGTATPFPDDQRAKVKVTVNGVTAAVSNAEDATLTVVVPNTLPSPPAGQTQAATIQVYTASDAITPGYPAQYV